MKSKSFDNEFRPQKGKQECRQQHNQRTTTIESPKEINVTTKAENLSNSPLDRSSMNLARPLAERWLETKKANRKRQSSHAGKVSRCQILRANLKLKVNLSIKT